jgi:hypothetical protein
MGGVSRSEGGGGGGVAASGEIGAGDGVEAAEEPVGKGGVGDGGGVERDGVGGPGKMNPFLVSAQSGSSKGVVSLFGFAPPPPPPPQGQYNR